jgi:hypothetical protein
MKTPFQMMLGGMHQSMLVECSEPVMILNREHITSKCPEVNRSYYRSIGPAAGYMYISWSTYLTIKALWESYPPEDIPRILLLERDTQKRDHVWSLLVPAFREALEKGLE